jgi:predicted metal-dependent hydrolase
VVAILPGITPPHLVAMHQEQEQLNDRIDALTAVTQSTAFELSDDTAQRMLAAQLFAMQSYTAILGARIHLARNPIKPATVQ